MGKIKIVQTHIENTVVNIPTIVFTDENGVEWVHGVQTTHFYGTITTLVKKENSWYFNENNKNKLI